MKIAITGHNGFIGRHLVNTLIYLSDFEQDDIYLVEKSDFKNVNSLKRKISNCQTLVHLAGVNRHKDSLHIYDENIRLAELIIENLSKKTKTIIFSSSIQQRLKNPFGEAKLECKKLFEKWSSANNTNFINLEIPNVFGPFGKPNYNSFVSTFCNNLVNNEQIIVEPTSKINLLYIDDLIKALIFHIKNPKKNITQISEFEGTTNTSVKSVYNILKYQWQLYHVKNTIPNITSKLELNLFNTLRSYISYESFMPKKLIMHIDERGYFSEILRTENRGQFSISTTGKGVTRGNHFHTRKIERFIVIQGRALVELRKIDSDKKLSFLLDGTKLNYIDIPIWYTHCIKNIGNEELVTLFWINEPYDPSNSDTYLINV